MPEVTPYLHKVARRFALEGRLVFTGMDICMALIQQGYPRRLTYQGTGRMAAAHPEFNQVWDYNAPLSAKSPRIHIPKDYVDFSKRTKVTVFSALPHVPNPTAPASLLRLYLCPWDRLNAYLAYLRKPSVLSQAGSHDFTNQVNTPHEVKRVLQQYLDQHCPAERIPAESAVDSLRT